MKAMIAMSCGMIVQLKGDQCCWQVRRTSEGSGGEYDNLQRASSPLIVSDHLAATSLLEDRDGLQFEVAPNISFNQDLAPPLSKHSSNLMFRQVTLFA